MPAVTYAPPPAIVATTRRAFLMPKAGCIVSTVVRVCRAVAVARSTVIVAPEDSVIGNRARRLAAARFLAHPTAVAGAATAAAAAVAAVAALPVALAALRERPAFVPNMVRFAGRMPIAAMACPAVRASVRWS